MSVVTSPSLAHSLLEDALALLMGTIFVGLGLMILKTAGLAIGGTAGLAFLAHFGLGLPFAAMFFVLNLPFMIFARLAFGTGYLVRTLLVTVALSLFSGLLPPLFTIGHVDPAFASVAGGLMVGMGMLALIRHRTGVGGVAIMAVWLQQRFGLRAGLVQMGVDAAVVAGALWVMAPEAVALSVLASVLMNLVIALYHRPGRYLGF
ncbi:YitT family protein [Chthonobacter rhizosphaerae]|uniref:YitT family protein n=1 Tax=Chthonobacter rhizosphaerae TaxID=2735553 RepID=UPI0015EFBA65|nr:YitT family protein [Chthonobacter rhizosphaerae]